MAKLGNDAKKQETRYFKIVHLDVCGPMENVSMGGTRYFVIFMDEFLKKVWVYMMKFKGEWFDRLGKFQIFVEMQLEHKIKAFCWMNRGTPFGDIVQHF